MTEAERIEACQRLGYSHFSLKTVLGSSFPEPGDEQAAYERGYSGENPDAAAIAAAEARGYGEALRAVRRLREMGTAARDVGVFYDALDDLLRAHGLTVDE